MLKISIKKGVYMPIYGKNDPVLVEQEPKEKKPRKNVLAITLVIIIVFGLGYAGILYLSTELTRIIQTEFSFPVVVEVVNPKLSK